MNVTSITVTVGFGRARNETRAKKWKWREAGRGKEGNLAFFLTPSPLFYLRHFFARSLTLVPRSLNLNRTETLATEARLPRGTKCRVKKRTQICFLFQLLRKGAVPHQDSGLVNFYNLLVKIKTMYVWMYVYVWTETHYGFLVWIRARKATINLERLLKKFRLALRHWHRSNTLCLTSLDGRPWVALGGSRRDV